MGEAADDEMVAVNTKGQYFTLQKALPLMSGRGAVVFTVGVAASRGLEEGSVAAGSTAALLGMILTLALELGPRGIRVNAAGPGGINTPLWTKSGMTPEMFQAAAP
ncbi:SDR family oxidoreductase [Nakamurella sp. YIM 132084]|uniref:SDR family oxidoreductase n=1 Tax=Nakamurella leprariae TaxID=2803911 RepID=A0A939C429_9ACTN|nr:SDR family oxidoreductase [Nakamurella leprariae]